MCIRLRHVLLVAVVASWEALGASGAALPENSLVESSTEMVGCSACQQELLEVALDVASSIPAKPHIKDRARMQEIVAEAWLTIGQPDEFLRCVQKIENWRKGVGYARYAVWNARLGQFDIAEQYLEKAERISIAAEDWRRDRIRATVASAYLLMGRKDDANRAVLGVDVSQVESFKRIEVEIADDGDAMFEEQVGALDDLVATGNFDSIQAAVGAYAQLYKAVYDDVDKRNIVEERVRASIHKTPIFLRLDTLEELAMAAVEHENRDAAVAFADEARGMIDEAVWRRSFHLQYVARVAGMRIRVGDTDTAIRELDDAMAVFEEDPEAIVDIYRAGSIRPLAEVYYEAGAVDKAMRAYLRALREGAVNPNARPRAQDLVATCCSMVVHGVEPDAACWAQIREVQSGLGNPW